MTAINSNRAIRGPVTAVPVVAGKGVRLVADTDNNRWVVEADETVLWEGTDDGTTTINFSESYQNFETIRIDFKRTDGLGFSHQFRTADQTFNQLSLMGQYCRSVANGSISLICSQYTIGSTTLTWDRGAEIAVGASSSNASANKLRITRVVGINRVSGGN